MEPAWSGCVSSRIAVDGPKALFGNLRKGYVTVRSDPGLNFGGHWRAWSGWWFRDMDGRKVVGSARRVLVAHAGAGPALQGPWARAGFELAGVARDGMKAVELALQLRPDVVVVDAALPGLDGISVTSSITGQGVGPVIVVMSASDADLVDQAVGAGAMACLVEPDPSSIVAATEMVLARQAANIALVTASKSKHRGENGQLIDRAKRLLMVHLRLTEAAALRWLHRTALEGRTSTIRIATIVIDFWSHRPVVARPVYRSAALVAPARPALYCC